MILMLILGPFLMMSGLVLAWGAGNARAAKKRGE